MENGMIEGQKKSGRFNDRSTQGYVQSTQNLQFDNKFAVNI
jgi:hypothetical protein